MQNVARIIQKVNNNAKHCSFQGGKHRKSALSHFLHFAKVQKCRNIFCTCTQSAEKFSLAPDKSADSKSAEVQNLGSQKCKCRSADYFPSRAQQKCRFQKVQVQNLECRMQKFCGLPPLPSVACPDLWRVKGVVAVAPRAAVLLQQAGSAPPTLTPAR